MSDDVLAPPRLSMAGESAILLNVAGPIFNEQHQSRIWSVAEAISTTPGIRDAVPGINNLMIAFDPLTIAPETVEARLMHLWRTIAPKPVTGQDFDVPVVYGGPSGEDLSDLAAFVGLSIADVVRLHTEPNYIVAALGALPGFAFLAGLNPRIARGRRPIPRLEVPEGAVMIGGVQAGINPCLAPSGWHIIGRTTISMFDVRKTPPATFRPGDRIRFRIAEIAS